MGNVVNMVFSSFTDMVIDLVSGEGILESFGNFLSSLGKMMASYGATMMAYGIAQEVFNIGTPAQKIVAGAALLATGIALTAGGAAINKAVSTGSVSSMGRSGVSSASCYTSGMYDRSNLVEFRIKGDDLVGVMNKTETKNYYNGI
jgi:hypothetical protein